MNTFIRDFSFTISSIEFNQSHPPKLRNLREKSKCIYHFSINLCPHDRYTSVSICLPFPLVAVLSDGNPYSRTTTERLNSIQNHKMSIHKMCNIKDLKNLRKCAFRSTSAKITNSQSGVLTNCSFLRATIPQTRVNQPN